jgi:hypothetical protein
MPATEMDAVRLLVGPGSIGVELDPDPETLARDVGGELHLVHRARPVRRAAGAARERTGRRTESCTCQQPCHGARCADTSESPHRCSSLVVVCCLSSLGGDLGQPGWPPRGACLSAQAPLSFHHSWWRALLSRCLLPSISLAGCDASRARSGGVVPQGTGRRACPTEGNTAAGRGDSPGILRLVELGSAQSPCDGSPSERGVRTRRAGDATGPSDAAFSVQALRAPVRRKRRRGPAWYGRRGTKSQRCAFPDCPATACITSPPSPAPLSLRRWMPNRPRPPLRSAQR